MTEALSVDSGEVLRLWLRSIPAVASIAGTRIGITLTGTAPAIRLTPISDTDPAAGGGSTAARWSVECWGAGGGVPDDGTSGLLARTVRQAAADMGGTSWGGARVAGCTAQRLYRQDDPTTGRPRHIVELAFITHP